MRRRYTKSKKTSRKTRKARKTRHQRSSRRRLIGGMPTIFASFAGIPASRERPTVVFGKLDPKDPYEPRTSMTLGQAAVSIYNATLPE